MLQWAEWLRRCVLGDRETIFVNLDETPMAKQMPARRGYVTNQIGTLDGDWHARITTRDTRSHATLMAAVCDDALLQKHLPHPSRENSIGEPAASHPLACWQLGMDDFIDLEASAYNLQT